MDVTKAIKERMTTRGFKPGPVPPELLRKIIEQALRAPSWANTQPWQFAVVTGQPLEEIKKGFVEREADERTPDIARPYDFPEPYISRIRNLSATDRTTEQDKDYRRRQNYKNHDAPVVIYLLIDRAFYYQSKGINAWSLYDCASAVQNIMLLATNYGLSTVAQASAVVFPDIIRKAVPIPDSKLIALGIAIGYADWDNPVNQSRSQRVPLDEVTTWYGFD
ncbi:MAG TPA: nitroreductase [Dehalococcoidales bacterium]|nr:nitroreductase [Dehalococcoidales bacterium]